MPKAWVRTSSEAATPQKSNNKTSRPISKSRTAISFPKNFIFNFSIPYREFFLIFISEATLVSSID